MRFTEEVFAYDTDNSYKKTSEVYQNGTEALVRVLGPIGLVRWRC